MENTSKDKLILFDTTLRDGEQSPSGSMLVPEKIEIAEKLDAMGVDIIEAGFAASSKSDFESMRQISKLIKNATICGIARAKASDIEATSLAIKLAKRPRIHTFFPTSDLLLKDQFGTTRAEALEIIHSSVRLAHNYCEDIEWSAMDATRSNLDFLARAIETAISAGAKTINLPDTVGYSTPIEYSSLIKQLKEKIQSIDKVILSAHCHNDLGLAVANTLAAIMAGARQAECTINGIGERAGNAAMEEVVMAIYTKQEQFPFKINVDPTHFAEISKSVSLASGFSISPNKAIVGTNAFAHASGIHQDGMLKNRQLYEIITPESVGFQQFKLVFGKHSGRAAFRYKLKSLGLTVKDEHFDNLFYEFKQLGESKKEISEEDILALVKV